MDEPGGFSSAELMRLLSPSCENLDSLLPHSDAWLPRVAPRTPRRTADCSFVRHLDDVELCHACPMRIGGGRLGVLVTDSSALVLAECRVRSRDESDVLTLSSKATKVPRRIQKVRELCEWRALVAYDAQVGVVGVGGGDDDAPCSLHLLQEPTWSADDALVATGVFPDDTAPRLACASARGTLTLIDAATMKPVARAPSKDHIDLQFRWFLRVWSETVLEASDDRECSEESHGDRASAFELSIVSKSGT